MTVHRYAVLDADGFKINTITSAEELIATDWYPGYGAALLDEGVEPPDPPKPAPPVKPDTWGVLPFVLAEPLTNGDKIDFKTGEVTRKQAPVPDPVPDPVGEIDPIVEP